MSLSDVLRLLARKWPLLVLVPVILGVSTYFFARHLPKTYSSDTTIYTGIASGYSLAGTAQTDYNSTSNAFDNLINLTKARSTKEEVIYQLLATHLWQTNQQPALLGTGAYTSLPEIPVELRRELTGATQLATLENVRRYARANTSNAIYQLLNSSNPTYSLAALNSLTAARIGTSDLIRLEFETYDPELCQYTLALATQVFLNQSRSLREGQTASVIEYYEAELIRAKARLTKAESENLAFNRDNNIINYDEQSKNVAAEREALATQLAQMNQEYAGAQAALQTINRKLGGRPLSLLSSREVIEQRQKLSRLNAAIADQQLYSQRQEAGAADKTKQLQAEADKTAKSMLNSVDDYYAHSNSTEGVPNKELLSEWMQDMVLVETSRAKLAVMNRRLQEFEHEYQRMAPLGASLKRIEREIDLAEKAYLTVLSSLNASKSSRQNTQLTATHLKIIDPPNLPLAPKTSKLLLLVLLSTVGGFVFTTGLVLALGLLDKSLKTPLVAAKRIGLPVAGIMLDTHLAPTKQLQASQQRSLDQLVRHILLKANTPPAPSPFVVGIFSVQRQEGKTTLCQALAQRCHEMGVQTLALYPDHDDIDDTFDVPSLFYPSEAAAVQGWPLDQLIQHAVPKRMSVTSAPNIQIVLIEFPALREEAVPVGVLRQLNLVFLTVPATRAWRLTDHQSVEYLRAATSAPVEVVLSGVAAHHGEEVFS
jgi:succinoglycan biosynthesis transport protein ExoP